MRTCLRKQLFQVPAIIREATPGLGMRKNRTKPRASHSMETEQDPGLHYRASACAREVLSEKLAHEARPAPGSKGSRQPYCNDGYQGCGRFHVVLQGPCWLQWVTQWPSRSTSACGVHFPFCTHLLSLSSEQQDAMF